LADRTSLRAPQRMRRLASYGNRVAIDRNFEHNLMLLVRFAALSRD
jgi:hypothetical protein